MRPVSYFFYYVYVGMILLAGFWGAFINPVFDYRLLFHFDIQTLPGDQRITILSQYRFLRAIELGFGIFAVLFTEKIFSEKKFNRLFIFIMSTGVLARIISIVKDGPPGTLFYFFLFFELAGVIVIYFYSHNLIRNNAIT